MHYRKRGSASYYRKRGSASYIVREVHSVRERERDTEKDGSDVTIVALIGDEFTLSLAKNSHNWRRAYTFPCQKIRSFRFSLHTSFVREVHSVREREREIQRKTEVTSPLSR